MLFKVLLLVAVVTVQGHDYSLGGDCHDVKPMENFDMDKMLGVWYAVQKVRTYYLECLTYNFTRGDEPGIYYVTQDSQNTVMKRTPLKHRYRHTGKLTMQDPKKPALLKSNFPYNLAGSSSYIIFDTDYQTYAGIYTCQELLVAKRYSATILSRTRDLDYRYIEKLRSKLSKANMNPYYLNTIDQNATVCSKSSATASPDDVFETRLEKFEDDSSTPKDAERFNNAVEFL